MDQIVVIGTSYKLANAQTMGVMTIGKEDIVDRLPGLAADIGARGLVYVATCNRIELIVEKEPAVDAVAYRRRVFEALLGRPPEPGESDRLFRVWEGEGALEHIFLVGSGFDSAQLGEREIYLQMRTNLKQARAAGTCSPLLDRVMVEALRVARDAHREMMSRSNPSSLAEVAVKHVTGHLQSLTSQPRVALVGVSPMTRSCFDLLDAQAIDTLVINRTLDNAEKLVAGRHGEAVALDEFCAHPRGADAFILAVGTSDPILNFDVLKQIKAQNAGARAPFIIDMGIPPNVDPDDALKVGARRMGMDEIAEHANESRTERLLELAPVRWVIDDGLDTLRRAFAERSASDLVAGLQDQYRHVMREAVAWLVRRELPHLSPDDKDTLEMWADQVAKRCAHIPVKGVKALSADHGLFSARTFLEASKDELIPDLLASLDDIDDTHLTE